MSKKTRIKKLEQLWPTLRYKKKAVILVTHDGDDVNAPDACFARLRSQRGALDVYYFMSRAELTSEHEEYIV
jgi:hypothetical protein